MFKSAGLVFILLITGTVGNAFGLAPDRKDYPRHADLESLDNQRQVYLHTDAKGNPLSIEGFRIFLQIFSATGRARMKAVEYYGYQFADVTFHANLGKGIMRFDDINGMALSGGTVNGFISLNYNTKPQTMIISLSVRDGLLSDLFGTHIDSAKNVDGIVKGRLIVTGSPFIPGYIYGIGDLEIKNGNFVSLPLFLNVVDLLGVPKFGDSKFKEGSAKFIFRKEGLYIRDMELKSDKISIENGEGFLGFDRSINMVMNIRVEPGMLSRILPPLYFLKKLYNLILQGLVCVRLEGTVDKPVLSILPFNIGKNTVLYKGPHYPLELPEFPAEVKKDNVPPDEKKEEKKK